MEFNYLSLHADVKRLSKDRTGKGLIDLIDEITIFLSDIKSDSSNLFYCETYFWVLSNLPYIFNKSFDLNMFLWDDNTNILILYDEPYAFKKLNNLSKYGRSHF